MYLWIVFYLDENYVYFQTFLNIYVYYQVRGAKMIRLFKNFKLFRIFPKKKKNFKNFGGACPPRSLTGSAIEHIYT